MTTSKGEKLGQIGVMIVAISAVAISIWQGQLMKRHNELTVRPYFNFTHNTNTIENDKGIQNIFEIQLANQGYGPAIFTDYYVEIEGQRFDDWTSALAHVNATQTMRQSSFFTENDVFAANQKQSILRLEGFERKGNIKIFIAYKSIYEEEFTIETSF